MIFSIVFKAPSRIIDINSKGYAYFDELTKKLNLDPQGRGYFSDISYKFSKKFNITDIDIIDSIPQFNATNEIYVDVPDGSLTKYVNYDVKITQSKFINFLCNFKFYAHYDIYMEIDERVVKDWINAGCPKWWKI